MYCEGARDMKRVKEQVQTSFINFVAKCVVFENRYPVLIQLALIGSGLAFVWYTQW